ncbi:bifunctional adenosylcobinamide kinase/adenosylcobinamide-phosphate guanylyltransferase [Clostridium manihotivorum]|uniref:Adenosylcobinamide kinase n=1 Tax=Clostridium manihotivorum TaxID=2320868 RepID=A0A3R5U8K8_9CLOT|nr:bifunctional adenosylcobinamide kinase/adenosylcobinamide-phosphate guanylyltransferase [Clostridium manihotivorum]QAA34836.1 bifunctional adenosylcobinamide kinase/adenosylcobinamide-phosphate guanylyltransferase [Clostridium manihotivorum]
MITLVTGGARSGKSSFGESLLKDLRKVLYIATSIPFDEEMKERVKKHKNQRPDYWDTLEAYKNFKGEFSNIIYQEYDGIIVDCITIMISNILLESFNEDKENDYGLLEDNIMCQVDELIKVLKNTGCKVVIVTNEVGSGIVPENKLSREFRDIAGRVNQRIAKAADEVYLVVSGLPVRIKGE